MMVSFNYNYQSSFRFPFKLKFCNPSGQQRTVALISMRKQNLKDSGSCGQDAIVKMYLLEEICQMTNSSLFVFVTWFSESSPCTC